MMQVSIMFIKIAIETRNVNISGVYEIYTICDIYVKGSQ